ncbi:hypothetical protein [Peterkaempfera sp. SMS 1(5)a]|uniref:hypothetical protein n=1 Tax=Peterkaempfera podocarpi TaxID=3232308 RepID=UPI003670C512
MPRNRRQSRRLVVGDERYRWSVRHAHQVRDGRYSGCREVLIIRPEGARGCLRIEFPNGPEGAASGGYLHSGGLAAAAGGYFNLHQPGTVRALLDHAVAGGWDPASPTLRTENGWRMLDTTDQLAETTEDAAGLCGVDDQ